MNKDELISSLYEELSMIPPFSRDEVYETFLPYVNNTKALRNVVDLGLFTFDYVQYKQRVKETLFEDLFVFILKIYHEAKFSNDTKTSEVFWKDYMSRSQGYARVTQLAWIHDNRNIKRIDILSRSVFRDIGDLIEGSLKPHLVSLWHLVCIAEHKEYSIKSLGDLVTKLIDYNEMLRAVLFSLFKDIPVSQWRNIADHCSYRVMGEEIEVSYGPELKNKRMFDITSLFEIMGTIDCLMYTFKTAYTLIGLEEPVPRETVTYVENKNEHTKDDDALMQVIETAYAYGFIVKDFDDSKRIVEMSYNKEEIIRDELSFFLNIVFIFLSDVYTVNIYQKDKLKYVAAKKTGKNMC